MSTPLSRHTIRLKGYDYAQAGAYFVTLCTQGHSCLFGEIVDGTMRPNDAARMVQAQWHALSTRFPGVELDAFIVMPNHIHGIIINVGAGLVPARGAGAEPGIVGDHKGRPYGGETTAGVMPARIVGAGLVPVRSAGARPGMAGDHEGRPYGGSLTAGAMPTRSVGAGLVPARGVGAGPGTVGDHKGRPCGDLPDGHGGQAVGGAARSGIAPAIGDIVGAFKSITTVLYARGTRQSAWQPFRDRVWQRNYYEHIIRDQASLDRIRQYIADNPMRWPTDRENPAVVMAQEERGRP